MNLPESLTASGFLDQHWQKHPLFMPAAFSRLKPQLAAEELAWLATLPDVESRLVFTERAGSNLAYRLEQGPFEEKQLASLPPSDWTLLVQDVDKHLPAFRELLAAVAFIPDWRLDDLMVSFAAPGGSVGPHQDNYDVFLCQGNGERKWRLAAAGSGIPATDKFGLSLLQPFAGASRFHCSAGDVLYLPPGNPHWGVASTACMTYSIGMRAPEAEEIRLAAERLFPATAYPAGGGDLPFYTDPDLGEDEAEPGRISLRALQRGRRCFPSAAALPEQHFAQVFGVVVTDPKAWLAPEGFSVDEVGDLLRRDVVPALTVHGMAKLAWCDVAGQSYVFLNGLCQPVGADELSVFQALCAKRLLRVESVQKRLSASSGSNFRRFLGWLLEQGAFDAESLD